MADYLADSYATVDTVGNVTFNFTGIIHALGLVLNEVDLANVTDAEKIVWQDASGNWQELRGYKTAGISELELFADDLGAGGAIIRATINSGGLQKVVVLNQARQSDFYILPTTGTIAAGSAGQVLTSAGAGVNPAFQAIGAYTSYTPVLTASVSNPTLGAGSSQTGSYTQIGKMVHYYGEINMGGAGFSAGSVFYRISLPVAAKTLSAIAGNALCFDSSANAYAMPLAGISSASTSQLRFPFPDTWSSGPVDFVANTAPWSWGQNDTISWSVVYEAA